MLGIVVEIVGDDGFEGRKKSAGRGLDVELLQNIEGVGLVERRNPLGKRRRHCERMSVVGQV